jgi:FkbM family methyltransferase
MALNLTLSGNSSASFDIPFAEDPSNYLLKNGDRIGNIIQSEGYYQKKYIDICSKFIKPGTEILDIGSNLGGWVIEQSRKFPSNAFYAFEPQQMTYYQLCANIFLNYRQNIKALRTAVSSDPTVRKMRFMIADHSDNGNSRLRCEYSRNPIGWISSQSMVPVTTIDTLELKKVGFINIDTNGHEEDVVRGGEKTIVRCGFPTIGFKCVEDADIMYSLIDKLREMGYVSIKIDDSTYIAYHRVHMTKDAGNYIISWEEFLDKNYLEEIS